MFLIGGVFYVDGHAPFFLNSDSCKGIVDLKILCLQPFVNMLILSNVRIVGP